MNSKLLAAALCSLALSGCFSDQKKAMARCEYDASKIYPSYWTAPMGQPAQTISLCMGAAGYSWVGKAGDGRCDEVSAITGAPGKDYSAAARCFSPFDRTERLLNFIDW